jgi:alpha-glucosidase
LNGDWYIGAMSGAAGREISIDLPFLDSGDYEAQLYEDGVNADRMASDFKKSVRTIKKGDKLTVKMVAGGGFAARLIKK